MSAATAAKTSAVLALSLAGCFAAVDAVAKRAWTTADSVKLQHVANAGPQAEGGFLYSPDGKLVAFIVDAADLEKNVIESRLRVYRTEALASFIDKAEQPAAVFSETLSKENGDQGFRELTWMEGGRSLWFIARSGNDSELARWSALDGRRSTLDFNGGEPISFTALNGETVAAFVASRAEPHRPAPLAATGMPLLELLDSNYERDMQLLTVQRIVVVGISGAAARFTEARGIPIQGLEPSPDGRFIAFMESLPADWQDGCWTPAGIPPRRAAVSQIAILDLASGAIRRPFQAPVGGGLLFDYTEGFLTWSPDGRHAIAHSTFAAGDRCEAGGAMARRSPATYLFSLDAAGEPVRLYEFDTDDNGAMPYYFSEAQWSRDSKTVTLRILPVRYAPSFRDGAPTDRKPKQLSFKMKDSGWRAVPGKQVPPGSAANSRHAVQLTVSEGHNQLPSILARNKTGATRTLADLAPHAGDIALVSFQPIQWKDAAGRTWSGLLGVPEGSGAPFPLIVQTHGIPGNGFFAEGASTSVFPGRAALARGFAVLHIEELSEAMTGPRAQEAPAMLDSYRRVVADLVRKGVVDASRVGLTGWSRTAYYTKYAIAHDPSLFGAAVLADGVDYGYWQRLAFNDFIDLSFGRQYDATYGGEFASHTASWLEQAPSFNAHKVSAPLRIEAYGKLSVLAEWEFHAALRIARAPVDFMVFPNRDHSLVNPRDRLTSTEGTLDWMDFWLNGHEDSDPQKKEQYERWRTLRDARTTQAPP